MLQSGWKQRLAVINKVEKVFSQNLPCERVEPRYTAPKDSLLIILVDLLRKWDSGHSKSHFHRAGRVGVEALEMTEPLLQGVKRNRLFCLLC